MKTFCIFLALASSALIFSDEWYSQECMLHIRSNGSAVVEVAGHFYEAGFLGHSPDCRCRQTVDDLEK